MVIRSIDLTIACERSQDDCPIEHSHEFIIWIRLVDADNSGH